MRVLLALDGSAPAESALRLVRSLPWPDGSVIDVVAAVEPALEPIGMTGLARKKAGPMVGVRRHPLEDVIQYAAGALETSGRVIRRTLLEGRPASAICEEAVTNRIELIVLGSRGLGPLKSMVLGSVSAEVVDHAPCPVLVVRSATVERILLAVDGSPSADAAVTFLGGSRFLAGIPVEVLTIATAPSPALAVPVAGVSSDAFDSYDAMVRDHRDAAESVAARAARSLRDDGAVARWSISQGDPAHEIIEAARDLRAGLVVMGSRGHAGLKRVLLGSVARNVLMHSDASVLIVREPLRVRSPRRASSAEASRLLPTRIVRLEA